jgi:hypothetical protein
MAAKRKTFARSQAEAPAWGRPRRNTYINPEPQENAEVEEEEVPAAEQPPGDGGQLVHNPMLEHLLQ